MSKNFQGGVATELTSVFLKPALKYFGCPLACRTLIRQGGWCAALWLLAHAHSGVREVLENEF